jgi:hypothetical protein
MWSPHSPHIHFECAHEGCGLIALMNNPSETKSMTQLLLNRKRLRSADTYMRFDAQYLS